MAKSEALNGLTPVASVQTGFRSAKPRTECRSSHALTSGAFWCAGKRRTPVAAADCLVINPQGEILLLKRNYPPFVGSWVLPGGHVEYGERVEAALKREVFEETGLRVKKIKLFGVYSDPKRDPRYHTISSVFVARSYLGKLVGDHESTEQNFFSLSRLPKKIGFDHRQIINDFKKWSKKHVPRSPAVTEES